MSIRNIKTIAGRRKFLEQELNFSFEAIKTYPKEIEEAQYRNCENMIGAIQVPMGVAGPLKILGQYASGDFYLPLATTEGALVASINRGCKAITASGGAQTFQELVGITRGSIFQTAGIKEGLIVKQWLSDNFVLLAKITTASSSHLRLIKIDAKTIGRNLFIRFYFDSSDAMGMNMATIAATKLAQFIEKETKIHSLAIAGNFDIDKKPAWLNFIQGRGRMVWAEAILPKAVVASVLKSTPVKIHETAINKCYLGSIISGSLGFNAHFANIIAALFLACGQDMAHTVEGSLGVTSTQIVDNNLYIAVYLPDLPIGTVGGGTQLPAQKEALSILGVAGGQNGQNASKFAEIIAAAVLAGEISLLSAIAQGHLAWAHQKLARKNNI